MIVRVNGKEIETTPEHPFYVDGKGWTDAQELEVGDLLISTDGQLTPVEDVRFTGETKPVYNMSITNDHTYFVGDADWQFSVWVHNTYGADPLHHLATNKNYKSAVRGGPWSPRFEEMFGKAGLHLDDTVNKIRVPGHKGPHPELYHRIVHKRLTDATESLSGAQYRNALIAELDALKKEVTNVGSLLNLLLRKLPID